MGGDVSCHLDGAASDGARGDDFVHQADRQGGFGVELASGQQHLDGARASDNAGKALGAAVPRHGAGERLAHGEGSGGIGYSDVAGEGDFQPLLVDGALRGADDGLFDVGDHLGNAQVGEARVIIGYTGERVSGGTAAEVRPFGGDYYDPHIVALARLPGEVGESVGKIETDLVPGIGPGKRDSSDGAGYLEGCCHGRIAYFISTTTCRESP